jgi:hypothetical protein
VPFVSVGSLAVGLNSAGIRFDTTAEIAGIQNVHLAGDFRLADSTYNITADAAVDWSPVEHVHLTDVFFRVTNRNPDGTAGDVRVLADAHLSLYGTSFLVAASVTSLGSWIAATPAEPWSPVPGLQLDYQFVVASSYDFVIQIDTQGNQVSLSEVASPPNPLQPNQRQIRQGISLVASSQLPDAIPAVFPPVLAHPPERRAGGRVAPGSDEPCVPVAPRAPQPQRVGRDHGRQPDEIASLLLELAGRASDRELRPGACDAQRNGPALAHGVRQGLRPDA